MVLVTGSSSGIGFVIAEYLHLKGYRVYGASRTIHTKNNFTPIKTDVTDIQSVNQAIDGIRQKEGKIDILINAAGYGIAGPIEETSEEDITAQFNTNFLGTVRLCKTVLPLMRQKRKGIIINLSSLAGIAALPFQGFYSASKFALEAMSESLRMEVAEFGIHVVLIEPGNFNTRFTANRVKIRIAGNSAYYNTYNNSLRTIEYEELNGPPPEKITSLIFKILNSKKPKLRYKTGPLKERCFISLKNILPYNLYEYFLKLHYRVGNN